MSAQKVKNRWLIVIGALLVQLCLGAIYAWGTFGKDLQNSEGEVALALSPALLGHNDATTPDATKGALAPLVDDLKQARTDLKKATTANDSSAVAGVQAKLAETQAKIKQLIDSAYQRVRFDRQVFIFSETQTQAVYSVGLAAFAVVMIMAGRWQDKAGPRKVAMIGGIVLGLGYILGGLVAGTSFMGVLVFVGLMGGAGIGLGYVCPIAACVKWFPDMKGFVTGLAVAGFGAGAFIFVKLGYAWLHLVEKHGINTTFLMFGVIFAVVVTLGGSLLSNPPAGWKPSNWSPTAAAAKKSAVADLGQGEIVKTPQFWMIWLTFTFSAGCGLMVLGCVKAFGGKEPAGVVAGETALAVMALFNGLGRIIWGTVSQKIGARLSVICMTLLQAAMMFYFFRMGSTELALVVAACWVGFNFGGNFALFPLLTVENFGSKNVGANYGAVFTAYGVGGIIGPILAGQVKDRMGTFTPAFLAAGAACVLAAIIMMALKPVKAETPAAAPAAAR
ncbi:MAG TPA: OFA family MFS transporter [Planctomycetota bacterium]|nr:OFA family MFS transporter [Planctomycetota bacterium]